MLTNWCYQFVHVQTSVSYGSDCCPDSWSYDQTSFTINRCHRIIDDAFQILRSNFDGYQHVKSKYYLIEKEIYSIFLYCKSQCFLKIWITFIFMKSISNSQQKSWKVVCHEHWSIFFISMLKKLSQSFRWKNGFFKMLVCAR